MQTLTVQDTILKDAQNATGPFARCKPALRQYAHPGFGTDPSLLILTEAPSSRQFSNRDTYTQPSTYADYWAYWTEHEPALLAFGLYRDFLRYVFSDFDCSGAEVFEHCLETGVVKWPSSKTGNERQFTDDAVACYSYLVDEIDSYEPKAIVAAGAAARDWGKQAVADATVSVPVFEINHWSWWTKHMRKKGLDEEDWTTSHIGPVVEQLKQRGFGTTWGPQHTAD